jgi:hypothetical protein
MGMIPLYDEPSYYSIKPGYRQILHGNQPVAGLNKYKVKRQKAKVKSEESGIF